MAEIMSISKSFLLKALLQHNYFPSQKKAKEELPPIINSKSFTPDVSTKLIILTKRVGGYDQVEFKSTRYNNVPRALSIPHPMAYAHLCHSLYDSWDKFKYITENKNSIIYPKKHNDGRIIIMDYQNSKQQIKRQVELSFNKRFYVNTDISNFYPSIYSHSIPWALVGFNIAKKNRGSKKWFNKIDSCQRQIKRSETNGVPIGPATSNIVSEAILARVDKKLDRDGFVFFRFIDDYTAYCQTYKEAERFIRRLSEELSKYKLLLNIKKTKIEQLPTTTSPEWIVDLTTRKPEKEKLIPTNAIRFLDYAVNKQFSSPDGSVLKYAAKSIINDVKNNKDVGADTVLLILQYVLGLCIKYPILLPLLDILFKEVPPSLGNKFVDQLLKILDEHATNRRSDAMAWSLYYINSFSAAIPRKVAKKVLRSEDCISILFLYLSKQYESEVVEFCNSLNKSDLFLLDQYWLLLYQLFFYGKIPNPYQYKSGYINHLRGKSDTPENAMKREIKVFETLKDNGVSFT